MQGFTSSSYWDQRPCSQKSLKNAPKPVTEDASVYKCIKSDLAQSGCKNFAVPFHYGKNASHQSKSSLKSSSNPIICLESVWPLSKFIMRRMKSPPAGTHLAANWSVPTRLWSLHNVDWVLQRQFLRRTNTVCCLPGEELRVCDTVSSCRPRKVRVVAGPSVFFQCEWRPQVTAYYFEIFYMQLHTRHVGYRHN